MLTILQLKDILKNNELLLSLAHSDGSLLRVKELLTHRAIVKDMLLAAYETELRKVG